MQGVDQLRRPRVVADVQVRQVLEALDHAAHVLGMLLASGENAGREERLALVLAHAHTQRPHVLGQLTLALRGGLAQRGGPQQERRARLDVALQGRIVGAGRLAFQHRQRPLQLVHAAGKHQPVRLIEGAPDGAALAVMLRRPTVQVVRLELRHLMVRGFLGLVEEKLLVQLGMDDEHAGMLAGLLAIGGQPVHVLANIQADLFAELVQMGLGILVHFEALLPGLLTTVDARRASTSRWATHLASAATCARSSGSACAAAVHPRPAARASPTPNQSIFFTVHLACSGGQ